MSFDVRIFGAGVAGCFLAHLLEDYKVEVVEKYPDFCPHCAFGWARYNTVRKMHKLIGVNTGDYVYHKIKRAVVNGVELKIKNVATFDKRKYVKDMREGINVVYGDIEDWYDGARLIVDATGYKRSIIAKNLWVCDEGATPDMMIKCVQDRLKGFTEPVIYIYGTKSGYAWAFPLDDTWHVGAGSKKGRTEAELMLQKLLDTIPVDFSGTKCKCTAPVLHVDPVGIPVDHPCAPIAAKIDGIPIITIGEAAFCTNGVGEGNTSAVESAYLTYKAIESTYPWNDSTDLMKQYIANMGQLWKRIHISYERTRAIERGFWSAVFAMLKYGSDSLSFSPKALLALWRVTHER